ncbi:MAG: Swt1 family HEPN domain-containing protein, partial [Treponema sp.]|nr:Swt1 family HEPN domain-containing protein [Treponema sp.]
MDKKRIGLYTLLFEYLLLLRKPFADFLSKHMKAVFDNEWWNNCVVPNIKEPFKKKMDDLDFYDLLRILINQWKELYTSITGKCNDNANDDNFKLLFDVLK